MRSFSVEILRRRITKINRERRGGGGRAGRKVNAAKTSEAFSGP